MTHPEYSAACFMKIAELVKFLESAGLPKESAKLLEVKLAEMVIDTLRTMK